MAKVKTIELVGAEVEVSDLGGQNVAVQNLGDGAIYASVYPNVEAGADNVIEIPAGGVAVVHDAHGKVYLLGTSKLQCAGTDYSTPNFFKLPSSSKGGGGGIGTGDVTKGYVDAQDASYYGMAKAYTDSKIGASEEAAIEAKTAAEAAKGTADAANAAATTASNKAEDIVKKSVVSEVGAFDLRYADGNLQVDIDGVWTNIATSGGSGSNVSQKYVDDHDAAALAAANEYTDTVAADKADKPINAFVLIGSTNWQTDDGEYPYYYNIPVEGVTSADRAEVYFTADSEEAAKKCEFSTEVTTSDGSVQIRAKHIPEAILSANVQIGLLSTTNTLHIGINGSSTDNEESVEKHNVDPEAHPDIRAYMNGLKGRIIALEVAAGGDVTANPFAVTFGDLDGVVADGVWVSTSARLEF